MKSFSFAYLFSAKISNHIRMLIAFPKKVYLSISDREAPWKHSLHCNRASIKRASAIKKKEKGNNEEKIARLYTDYQCTGLILAL